MIPVLNPSDSAFITLEWDDLLGDTVTLVSVTHTVPSPLSLVSQATDTVNSQSQARVSGAVHGAAYQIIAAATLSNGEIITRVVPAYAFNA